MASGDASSPVEPAAGLSSPTSPLSPTSPSDFYDAKQSLESPSPSAAVATSPVLAAPPRPGSPTVKSLADQCHDDPGEPAAQGGKAASEELAMPDNEPSTIAHSSDPCSHETVKDKCGSKSKDSHEPSTSKQSDAPAPLEATAKTEQPPAYASPASARVDDPEKIEALPAHLQQASSDGSADGIEKEKPTRPSLARRQTTRDDSRPPQLHYTLRTRKLYITIFWSLILIDSIAIPLVLYFCLHYLTSLSPNAVFSISTACLGGISILEYVLRFWRLWKASSKCRVIGGKRWYLDWFHFNFSAAWIFIMVELIVGTSPDDPPIRLLAMPLSSLCYFFCLSLIAQDILRVLKIPQPFRISSLPRGSQFRPGIYHIIEDICAVDGSGGTIFRRRLNARWIASHDFRQMIHRLTLVWSVLMLAVAIATTVLVFTLRNGEIAYIIGWTVPFVGAGFLTLWTFWYVKRCLKSEYANWAERRGQV